MLPSSVTLHRRRDASIRVILDGQNQRSFYAQWGLRSPAGFVVLHEPGATKRD
jgi:hypothetical protein